MEAKLQYSELVPDIPESEINIELSSRLVLESVINNGVEVADPEGVAASLDEIRRDFEIPNDIFNNPKTALLMSAISSRLNDVEKSSGTFTEKVAEREYVAYLVTGVVGRNTKYNHLLEQDSGRISEDYEKKIVDKYVQPEVTKDMEDFIRGPQFDKLRERLGITKEEPFEVKVLSLTDEESTQKWGLDPGINWESDVSFQELSDERDYRLRYFNELNKRGKKYNEEIGRDGSFAPAWVSNFEDGTKYLCLSLPTAEKVLYTEEDRSSSYSKDDQTRELAIVEHEYVHTQKFLATQGTHLGIGLEELRAEYFSGNLHGYTDVKKFFSGIKMLTGYDVSEAFERDGAGYDEERFVYDIAQNIGLDGLLDCIALTPANYAEDEDANPITKKIVAVNGGSVSSHFNNFYKRVLDRDGPEVIDARVSTFIDRVYNNVKDSEYVTLESVLSYGGVKSFAKIGIDNFRRRYPDSSDGYDYFSTTATT